MSFYTTLSDWYVKDENAPDKPWYFFLIKDTYYKTTKEVVWEVGRKGSNLFVVVPEGYYFNVSIPIPFWPIFSPHDPKFLKAACVHDWTIDAEWDRVTAGGLFSDALKADRVNIIKRFFMVGAVTFFKFR